MIFHPLRGRGVLQYAPTIIALLYLLSSHAFGETQVLFSPRGSIRDHILKHINDSTSSIEIAIYDFTSGDIAEALVNAESRGVRIGIVMDKKRAKREGSLYEFLKDEGFDVQLLKGRVGGSMHNNFVIFDGKLVLTGSYVWTEYAEKFNYENVIVTDEKAVVEIYQKEFKRLYEGTVAVEERKQEELVTHLPPPPAPLKTVPQEQIIKEEEEKVAEKPPPTSTKADAPDKEFIDITFEELDKIFGRESALSRAEKKEKWKEYRGKYVRWTGEIAYKGIGRSDWNRMGVKHTDSDTADIELWFGYKMKMLILRVKKGQVIRYTGMLHTRRGYSAPYRIRNAWIEKVFPAETEQQGDRGQEGVK